MTLNNYVIMKNKLDFDAQALSGLGQTASIFVISLIDMMEELPIKVLSSDMSVLAGLDRFKDLYPDNFYNVGIAEQNLIGIASGLASEGFKSIAVAQASFITMRCFEQIRQYLGYMKNNVILVGINSGFALKFMGNTHYTIEDLSLMRGVPGMTVLSPADAGEAVKAFEASLLLDTPVYIRLMGGTNTPVLYKSDYHYEIGKSNILHEGKDITIFATGSMVFQSLKAIDILESQGLSVKLVDVHTIKPFDNLSVDNSVNCELFISVEEHSVIGGLGASISNYISENVGFPPLLKLGVQDTFSNPGDYEYLLTQHRLVPELIAEDVIHRYRKIIR